MLALALLAFGTGVFVVLRQQLLSSFDAALIANAEHAASAFAQDIDAAGRLRPSERLLEQLASTGGRVVVLDPQGETLADSASSTPSLPISTDDLSAAARHDHRVEQVEVAGVQMRMRVEPVSAADGAVAGFVAWSDATRTLRDLFGYVAAALIIGGLLVTAAALVAGLILARRALHPVADVSDTARAIALSGDFGARVKNAGSGDEVRELGLAFNEMLAALEQNHQALQQFLGDASHQLRTPLTAIRANLELAERSDLPPEERRALLADAREEAERMGRLIGDLLSLARANSGARLEFAPVELDAALVESVRRQRSVARHVRLSVTHVEPAVVYGDRDRLHELVGVLLDNAARYTPAGGSVLVRLDIDGANAIVRVEDTGIGIDAQDRERMFERLYRGPRARAMRPGGTGLGLAIARWIVEAHGGTINLEARAGGGTVVTVNLPIAA